MLSGLLVIGEFKKNEQLNFISLNIFPEHHVKTRENYQSYWQMAMAIYFIV